MVGPFRDLPREVAALSAVGFAVAVGFGIVSPALPVYARDFGVGRAAAAAVVSIFALVRLASAFVGGSLVSRFGERRVLATGIGIVAVSSLLAGVAANYPELLALRGAGGLGSAMFSVSATTLLLRSVPTEHRARASGLYAGGFLVGGISGPALGGLVTGVSIRLPFFLYAGTLVVAGAIGLRMLPRTIGAPPEQRMRLSTQLIGALRMPTYRAALAAQFADNWAAMGVRSALIPLFVADQLHRSSLVTGGAFAVVAAINAATLLPAGRLADRIGRRPVLVAGLLLSGAALTLLAVLPDLAGLFAAMAVLGIGSGFLDVAPAAMVGDVAGEHGGPLVAGYQMSGDVGTVTAPVVTGHLADLGSYPAAFGMSAAIVGLAALVAVRAQPENTQLRTLTTDSGADDSGE